MNKHSINYLRFLVKYLGCHGKRTKAVRDWYATYNQHPMTQVGLNMYLKDLGVTKE